MTRNLLTRTLFAIAALLTAIASAATPARADRCDDLASQLKNQIDGLAVGKTAANLIYLSHPKAKEFDARLRRAQLRQPAVRQVRQPQASA